ncbi:TIM barrel protein [Candidatus Woesearchaeota archaeon]|nr:TIM barrel protein [Candidatus Woesearchaeota archaeon]
MIRLGPAGVSGMGYEAGLNEIARLGLNALELSFTYGVRMPNEQAKEVGKQAKKLGIALSIHGPYYINLASLEKEKITASIKRILDSCERAHHMGAKYVVYHSGFFQKQDPKKVAEIIQEQTGFIMDKIKENGWKTTIAPELTGKPSQFGSIPELMELRKQTGCHITIDFAHQLARNQGKIDYEEIFTEIRSMNHIHAHFSGIVWGPKGERHHKITEKKDILPLAKEILKRKADITIINESPSPLKDSVKTKKVIDSLSS